ncbi:MAG: glycosyltransferase family 39 protein [Bacteroidales bacterium]|nr:glycosyltransferase family 39 protein [Clostridia bacterium]MCF0178926.1 glycosyltransferase family 39 protein [Bacteroidales bacterium]
MKRLIKIDYLPITIALFIALGFMVYFLTVSPLWVDEAVEYFYSKVMIGSIPGEDSTNMYQRICSTFQPPLYNVVMYVWLSIYDTEWWYRLFGVIVTLIGGIAMYKSVNLLVNNKLWSSVSMLIYLLTPFMFEYALECAEYNLMLCFDAWSVFYFLKSIINGRFKDYALYFLFAVLAVYSQYGAAILEVVLFTVLFIDVIRRKDSVLLKDFLKCSIVTIVFAAVPLIFFFMIPQMENQGTLSVSHNLVLAHDNILIDLIYCIRVCIATIFRAWNIPFQIFIVITLSIAIIAFATKKNKLRIILLCSFFAMWILYYLLVAFSLYGYNDFALKFGTENIGRRYMLFTLPLFFLIYLVGLYKIPTLFPDKWHKTSLFGTVFVSLLLLAWSIRQQYMARDFQKDDVKNAVMLWFSKTDKSIPTYVHDWQYFNFLFYLSHNDDYSQIMSDKVIKINIPTQNYHQIESRLGDKSAFQYKRFYLVMSEHRNNYTEFLKVLSENEYSYTYLYDETTKLLLVEKNE